RRLLGEGTYPALDQRDVRPTCRRCVGRWCGVTAEPDEDRRTGEAAANGQLRTASLYRPELAAVVGRRPDPGRTEVLVGGHDVLVVVGELGVVAVALRGQRHPVGLE